MSAFVREAGEAALMTAVAALNRSGRTGAVMAPTPTAEGCRAIYVAHVCPDSYTVPAEWAEGLPGSMPAGAGLVARPSPFAGRLVHYVVVLPRDWPASPYRIDPAPWNALQPPLLHPFYEHGVYREDLPPAGMRDTEFGVPAGGPYAAAPLQYWTPSVSPYLLARHLSAGVFAALGGAHEWERPACHDGSTPMVPVEEAALASEARAYGGHDAAGARAALAALPPDHAAALRQAVVQATSRGQPLVAAVAAEVDGTAGECGGGQALAMA